MNSDMTKQLDQLFCMWNRGLCPGAQVLIRQHGETLYENVLDTEISKMS